MRSQFAPPFEKSREFQIVFLNPGLETFGTIPAEYGKAADVVRAVWFGFAIKRVRSRPRQTHSPPQKVSPHHIPAAAVLHLTELSSTARRNFAWRKLWGKLTGHLFGLSAFFGHSAAPGEFGSGELHFMFDVRFDPVEG